MGTISVPDFSNVTILNETDLVYLIQGSGVDRDKNCTIATLQAYIGDVLIAQDVTGSIDLSMYTTNVVVKSDPSTNVTLTFTGALPVGKKLFIWNVSSNIVSTVIEGVTLTVIENEYQDWVSDGANMIQLFNVFSPNVFKKKHITFADSPYTVTDNENYDLYTFDDSGGDIVFNLPALANNYNKKIECKKITGDNKVVITGSSNILDISLSTLNLIGAGQYATVYGDEDGIFWDVLKTNITFYAKISDTKTQATDGGTFTSGAWQTRDINTEEQDNQNLVSVSTNQITLLKGTYRFIISCPALGVTNHVTRLRNITDTTTIKNGTSEFVSGGDSICTRSLLVGEFTIEDTKILEIQHYCGSTKASNGFGQNGNITGENEVYTIAEFWRI